MAKIVSLGKVVQLFHQIRKQAPSVSEGVVEAPSDLEAPPNPNEVETDEAKLLTERIPLSDREERGLPTIFKVHPFIRAKDEAAFDPLLVSIGPYHRGRPHLKAMEATKRKYRQNFIDRNPNMTLQDYHQRIHGVIDRARACYLWDDATTVNDDDFVEMLVVDGCFILEVLLPSNDDPLPSNDDPRVNTRRVEFDPIFDVYWTFGMLYLDLLKLENQLPYFVLDILYDDMYQHLLNRFESGSSQHLPDPTLPPEPPPTLEMLTLTIMERGLKSRSNDHLINSRWKVGTNVQDHLLHFLHSCTTSSHENVSNNLTDMERIPTAKELLDRGLEFQIIPGHPMEVTFTNGVLKMTPLYLDDASSSLFHNLIAFEQCCPEVGGIVTAYCLLVDYLIDTPTDVQLLRQAEVLTNDMGSDKETAVLVNNLCKNVSMLNIPLSGLFIDVNKYCNRRWPRWRANLIHNYFNSPWTIISVVAAVILLLLATCQTFFAALSYFHPPK